MVAQKERRRALAAPIALLILLLTAALPAAPEVRAQPAVPETWRVVAPQRPQPLFHEGTGIGVDRWHNVYVSDPLEGRVRKFSASGKILAAWDVAAQPGSPSGLGVSPDGAVYAVAGNGIARIAPSGRVLSPWPGDAVAVAVGGSGNVILLSVEKTARGASPPGCYVRVDKLSPAGAALGAWRSPFIAALAVEPDGIALDRAGDVDVTVATDTQCYHACIPQTSVLYRLSPSLTTTWTFHPGGGMPFGPVRTVDGAGNIYLWPHPPGGGGPSSIVKLSPAGKVLAQWGGSSPGALPFGDTLRLASDDRGRLYAADSHTAGNPAWSASGVVRTLTTSGAQIAQWGRIYTYRELQFPLDLGLTVDRAGTIYFTGGRNDAVYSVMSLDGRVVRTVGSTQGKKPPVYSPRSIALDARDDVYVADGIGGRIARFSPTGRLLATWYAPTPQYAGLDALALDGAGNVYVTASGAGHILKFSAAGKLLATFGSPGSGPGQFGAPSGIAVDRSGDIWVCDTYNNRVQELSPSGRPLAIIGGKQVFDRPTRLALDPSGNVYVTDLTHDRIWEFTPAGAMVRVLGGPGIRPGQLDQPIALAFDGGGSLYVDDYGNDRIQEFGRFLPTSGGQAGK
ncbi:MAG: hypothetical protein JOZ41_13515 [Chloroflexi bacterium]|nr:hypothetical protein [Chloroflexota bacterium]